MPKVTAAPPLTDEAKQKLYEIYTDPANRGSFGGVRRLWDAAKQANVGATYAQVREWLTAVPTYTRYRTQRIHFPRRQVIAFEVNWLWEVSTNGLTISTAFSAGP